MLKELEIRDFALVEHVCLPLSQGFNVLTGETGAGKSIIMDALNLVLGGRATAGLIRPGGEKAVIEATFVASDEVRQWLLERELQDGDGVEFTVSREISKTGSKLRINGTMVNAATVAELGERLVTVHAQHEARTLLSGQSQMEMLDALHGEGKESKLLLGVRELYLRRKELQARMAELQTSESDRQRRLDFARFQLEELKECELESSDEDEAVATERKKVAGVADLQTLIAGVQSALKGGEGDIEYGVAELLDRVTQELSSACSLDPALQSSLESLSACACTIEDEYRILRKYGDGLEADPERLAYLEERHARLATVKRKYGPSLADAIERLASLEREITELESADSTLAQLSLELGQTELELERSAGELSSMRKALAKKISAQIEIELGELGMGRCRFEIDVAFDKSSIGPSGGDRVEFLIAPNPGQPSGPVARIASGGELSRVMLAVKTIFAGADKVNTVIFDEIDTGLSGSVLESMRDKLARLALSHQILCITHQPIIAAVADNHVFVSKEHTESSTFTRVKVLDDEARVEALAAMAGGESSKEAASKFARSLFAESLKVKAEL